MCLSLNYNSMTSECWLFGDSWKTIDQGMINDYQMDFYERIFYRGGAVVDEVINPVYQTCSPAQLSCFKNSS